MSTTPSDVQVKALVACLAEAIGAAPIADCDENIAYKIAEGQSSADIITWAVNWDLAIEFYNTHCDFKDRCADPWVVATAMRLLEAK